MSVSIHLGTVLVVSDSVVFREMLRRILAPHADEVFIAEDRESAREVLAANHELDLLVAETALPDGSGFELLADAAELCDPKPRGILISTHADPDLVRRAKDAGAVGLLAKPISFRDLASVLKHGSGAEITRREPRRRVAGLASVLDARTLDDSDHGADPQLVWNVRDVSASGAFLEADSPLPLGTRLELELELGGRVIAVSAEVVRNQEPSWSTAAGVGVRFVGLGSETRVRLSDWVADGLSW